MRNVISSIPQNQPPTISGVNRSSRSRMGWWVSFLQFSVGRASSRAGLGAAKRSGHGSSATSPPPKLTRCLKWELRFARRGSFDTRLT